MFELPRSPMTGGLIPALPASLLFLPGPILGISRHQSCAISRGPLRLLGCHLQRADVPVHAKASPAGATLMMDLHYSPTDCCSLRGAK